MGGAQAAVPPAVYNTVHSQLIGWMRCIQHQAAEMLALAPVFVAISQACGRALWKGRQQWLDAPWLGMSKPHSAGWLDLAVAVVSARCRRQWVGQPIRYTL